ncbi:hypothetical protein Ancab_019367 [Ancistrocladus abbreviatus]
MEETRGNSEKFLGHWIRDRRIPRDRIALATKLHGFAQPYCFSSLSLNYFTSAANLARAVMSDLNLLRQTITFPAKKSRFFQCKPKGCKPIRN